MVTRFAPAMAGECARAVSGTPVATRRRPDKRGRRSPAEEALGAADGSQHTVTLGVSMLRYRGSLANCHRQRKKSE